MYHYKKKCAICDHTCILVYMQRTRYSFQINMKLQFSGQIFEEFSIIKFRENLLETSCSIRTDGWTDRHDAFRNFSNTPNKTSDFG